MINWDYNMHKLVATEYERKATRNAETSNSGNNEKPFSWKRNRRQR